MTLKSLLLSVGLLFTVAASSSLMLTQSAIAGEETPLSDVTGISVTTSGQTPGSTTFVTPTKAAAVNSVAASFNTPANITGTQTVGNVNGESVAVVVNISAPLATDLSSLLSGSPIAGYTFQAGITPPITSPSVLATQIATALVNGNSSPTLVNNATVLSVSLQGLTNGGTIASPAQLLVAVQAYNALATTASGLPGGIAALGPQFNAIHAILGKMVDAAYQTP